jgi:hypothetical protein
MSRNICVAPIGNEKIPGPQGLELQGGRYTHDGLYYVRQGSVPYGWGIGPVDWNIRYCQPLPDDPRTGNDSLDNLYMSDVETLGDWPIVAGVFGMFTSDQQLMVWTTDPAGPVDGDGNPSCSRIAAVTVPAYSIPHLFRIGDATKVVVTSPTHVASYRLEGSTLVLEAEGAIDVAKAFFASVVTDGDKFWIGFSDATLDGRPSVFVQEGAAFVPVGHRGFAPQASDPVLTASGGHVYAAFQRLLPDVDNGYAALFVATPN